jgi:hypothetical protein
MAKEGSALCEVWRNLLKDWPKAYGEIRFDGERVRLSSVNTRCLPVMKAWADGQAMV